jgi:hypothetical protein
LGALNRLSADRKQSVVDAAGYGRVRAGTPGTQSASISKIMENRVLFICTGNYYRSRFAEAVFNHHAEALGLRWRAFSRGLAIHLVPPGFVLSPHTLEHLKARRMEVRHTAPDRRQLTQVRQL